MKVLNLYSGIGGNRKLWEDVEVTAVEIDPKIAAIYSDFFPDDKMVVGDAHQYLLDHCKEFDFIWSSPPCPTHSRARKARTDLPSLYPDMKLYQEVIFLENHFDGLYCVENVISYYDPLIRPQVLGRHYFWANFHLRAHRFEVEIPIDTGDIETLQKISGFNLSNYNGFRKDTVLRNCVNPELGKIILDCARGNTQVPLTSFSISKRNDNDE